MTEQVTKETTPSAEQKKEEKAKTEKKPLKGTNVSGRSWKEPHKKFDKLR